MQHDIKLGKQQQQAVDMFRDWYQPGQTGVFYLGGYAGTGKTTTAKVIYDAFNCVAMAPTGKAAEVLTRKGIPAKTIHSCIYKANRGNAGKIKKVRMALENGEISQSDGERELHNLIKNENPSFELSIGSGDEVDIDLIICDEFSMVTDKMLEDMLNLGIPILALGDPGQLPPVGGRQSHKPDFTLTEIHRQAEDNPIIMLSMMAREDGRIPFGDWGAAKKIKRSDYDRGLLFEHDQIICGRNATRHKINRTYRKEKGLLGTYPLSGERLICLKNDHERGFVNGMMCTAAEDFDEQAFMLSIDKDGDRYDELTTYVGPFCETYGQKFSPLGWDEKMDMSEFDYGYAITCHKSQGSEWDSVFVIEEPTGRSDEERARWLYTAVTRAKSKLTIMPNAAKR